ncbi:MAG: rod shape-determining protein MreD [Planctomycetia bacterium]|nr:rod shape-determining protein MreD [Planctomycetia bacterium]
MPNVLLLLVLTYLAAVIETAGADVIAVYRAAPSLLAITAIGWTVMGSSTPWRIAHAAVVGLVFDLNGGGHAGIGIAAFALTAFVAMRLRPWFRRQEPVAQAVATAPLVAALMIVVVLGNAIVGEPGAPPSVAVPRATVIALYTSAVSLPLWMLLDWVRESGRLRAGTSAL